jgi:hypothetical protein
MSDFLTAVDAWRRVCLSAFDNLAKDTTVTMAQVDAVLMAGAREAGTFDTSTIDGAARYGRLVDRVSRSTSVDHDDVDSILSWCAKDATRLLGEPRPDPVMQVLVFALVSMAIMVGGIVLGVVLTLVWP